MIKLDIFWINLLVYSLVKIVVSKVLYIFIFEAIIVHHSSVKYVLNSMPIELKESPVAKF